MKYSINIDYKPSTARRVPQQARSHARVERVLAAAAALIGAHGSDRVTMSDIARASGVAMGSLYAYFDGKPAIIAALAEQMMRDVNGALLAALARATTADAAVASMLTSLDRLYRLARDNPVWQQVWVGMQADADLQALDIADSMANGERLAAALQAFVPAGQPAPAAAGLTLLLHLSGATVRLAAALDRAAGDAMVAHWRAILARDLRRMLAMPAA